MQTIFGASGTIEGSKGISVSITPKGDYIDVLNGGDSITTENGGYNIAGAGSFSVYKRNATTGIFSLLGSTISEEESGDGSFDFFSPGRVINISKDGKRVALGNPGYGYSKEAAASDEAYGKAYVYEYKSVNSAWNLIFNTSGWETSQVGTVVSISAYGKSVAVKGGDGEIKVFEEDSALNWNEASVPLINASPSGPEGVALSTINGKRTTLSDSTLNFYIGGTYVYDKVGPDWVLNANTPLMGLGRNEYGDQCGAYGGVAISANGTK